MPKSLKNLTRKNESYIFLVIVVVSILIEIRSGQFLTANNFVDVIRALIVPHMFGIGLFMIMVSGGIDVSFPALASLSCFITTRVLLDIDYQGSVLLPIVMTAVIGLVLGAFNGLLIVKFKFPALIITLATQSIFRGITQGVFGAVQIPLIPPPMRQFGVDSLFTAANPVSGLTSKMPVSAIIWVIAMAAAYFVLRHTMFGRGIYAVGGNEDSAERAGFNVKSIKFWLYTLVGMLASVTGLIRFCMMDIYDPTNLIGSEMMVIAAVILGGTALTGGKGSLTGVLLGSFLIVVVQNSLILLGVPTFWQDCVQGLLIIIGTGVSALQVDRASRKLVGLKDVEGDTAS